MKIVRLMFLVGSAVFAMGAVGCGDDDDTTFDARTADAPVTQIDGGSTAVDARVVDAQTAGG